MKVVSWCAKVPMISPSLTNPQRLPLLSSTGAPEISFSVKSLRASSALAFSLTEKTSVCISEESTLASATLSSFCTDCSFCKLMRKARKNPFALPHVFHCYYILRSAVLPTRILCGKHINQVCHCAENHQRGKEQAEDPDRGFL